MKKFLINNKKMLFAGAAIILVFAFAFWYGGNSPSSRGWSVPGSKQGAEYASADEAHKANGEVFDNAGTEAGATEQGSLENKDSLQPEVGSSLQAGTPGSSSESGVPSKGSSNSAATPSKGSTASGSGTGGSTPSASGSGTPSGSGETSSSGSEQVTKPDSHSCTISISCKTILNNMSSLKPNKTSIVPSDGWVLKTVEIEFKDGETVFDVLQAAARKYGIHMEYSKSPLYNSMYIEGIANFYEFDCGDLSGWMYKVNDVFPNYGCSLYEVQDGDVINWVYTCDLGNDVGGSYSTGN